MKRLLLIGLAVVLIAIAGLAVAVRMLMDPERVRSTIAAQASAALGMPVSLEAVRRRCCDARYQRVKVDDCDTGNPLPVSAWSPSSPSTRSSAFT